MTKQPENLVLQAIQETHNQPTSNSMPPTCSLPIGYMPTPTRQYRAHRKGQKATLGVATPNTNGASAVPLPLIQGSRALLWKPGSCISEPGLRKTYLPGNVIAGPSDARMATIELPAVCPNALGDFVQTPGTDAFDCVHTFSVARQTLMMYQRALGSIGSTTQLPWQWNTAGNIDPLTIAPHGLPDTMNAFYSRSTRALRFGDFIEPGSTPPARLFTCRSIDVVAHTTGHAILDGLKPSWIMGTSAIQTGALHESFADLTAIFLGLCQLDEVEAVIAQTRANLHDKTFLTDLAEEFGLVLGRPNGLRNADNNLRLSEVPGEVNVLAQVFTGGIYDVLADIFAFERKPAKTDDAVVLYAVAQYLCGLLLRAIMSAPANNPTFADVVNQMLIITAADGKPVQYRNYIRNRFAQREVVIARTSLTSDLRAGVLLDATSFHTEPRGVQNRAGCCGTMQHCDFTGASEVLEEELEDLKKAFSTKTKGGRGVTPVTQAEENGLHAKSRL